MENLGFSSSQAGLLSTDNIIMSSKRLPTFIGIYQNKTISKASKRRLRKAFNISFVGKTKAQQKKLLKDFGLNRPSGKRFKNEKFAYLYLARTFNEKVEQKREEIKEKRRIIRNRKRRAKRQLKKLETMLIRFDTTGMENFEVDFKDMSRDEILNTIVKTLNGKNVVIKITLSNGEEKYYTLNANNVAGLIKAIQDYQVDETDAIEDYNLSWAIRFNSITKISVEKPKPVDFLKDGKPKENPNGGFFKYLNKTHFDLSRYGIYKEVNPKHYNDNCLVKALKFGGLDEDRLNELKSFVVNRYIPMCKLKEVAESLDIMIKVQKDDSSKKKSVYGDNEDEVYELGLLDKHFFLNEKVNFTKYSIKNYTELSNEFPDNNFNTVFKKSGKYFKKSNDRFTDSFKAIKELLNQKDELLEPISFTQEILTTQFYDEAFDLDTLTYPDECVLENDVRINKKTGEPYTATELAFIEEIKEQNQASYSNVFFDFETYTEEIDGRLVHIPYLCCWRYGKTMGWAFGKNCGRNMLEWCINNCPVIPVEIYDEEGNLLPKYNNKNVRVKLIAHNAGYDYRFISKYLFSLDQKTKGSGLMNASGLYMNKNKKIMEVEVKDSYKIITMPLAKFGKCFGLKQGKEVMPYGLYNRNSLAKSWIETSKVVEHLKKESDYDIFIENCKKWDILRVVDGVELFNLATYSLEYCKIDVNVLKRGYCKFRKWILEECGGIDINNVWTIASLADKYLHQEGVYEGVYKLSGVPRIFIQKCVVGGRTMCRDNKKYWLGKGNKKSKIADFDAVSLYPSAMVRMEGTLIGKPKVIPDDKCNQEFLNSVDGYFVKVKITKVGKNRHFSLLSQVNENNVRVFHNDMVGKIFYLDKTSLEDAVRFMDIEYDIIKGYYYDEGRNPKIRKVMRHLFNQRLAKKAEKNPVQVVYKLIMNSSYGKSILKPINTEEKIIDNEEKFLKFLQKNYNKIIEYNKFHNCNKYRVKLHKAINEHFNNAAVGVEILSMSKRIMNEVICLAEDEQLKIYYQDTDSIHIDYDEVMVLKQKFTEKYGRELDGKQLGQFHIDFDLEVDGKKATDESIVSEEFIALGKKCYIDSLVGKTEDGEVIRDYHIRMKGVPNSTIKYTAEKHNISVLQLYRNMYRGQEYEFDLLEGGGRCNFKFGNDGSITSMNEFRRTLVF
mgnify:CR=1 FL=1